MLGFDDFLLILGATTIANLVVEIGAEIIAEWVVVSPDSPFRPGEIDPSAASEEIGWAPDLLTPISAQVDQAASWSERVAETLGADVNDRLATKLDQTAVWSGHVVDRLSAKADVLSAKVGETMLWSEQMISALATGLGLQ